MRVSRKEFRILCGNISTAYVSQNVKRGKIIEGGDKSVDITILTNKEFMDKLRAKRDVTITIQEIRGDQPTEEQLDSANQQIKLFDQEKRDIALSIERERLKALEMKRAKMMGELIPTKEVKPVVQRHFKNVTTCFHQGANSIIDQAAHEFGASRKQLSKMRGQIIDVINESVRESMEIFVGEIDNMTKEIQEARGVGESK